MGGNKQRQHAFRMTDAVPVVDVLFYGYTINCARYRFQRAGRQDDGQKVSKVHGRANKTRSPINRWFSRGRRMCPCVFFYKRSSRNIPVQKPKSISIERPIRLYLLIAATRSILADGVTSLALVCFLPTSPLWITVTAAGAAPANAPPHAPTVNALAAPTPTLTEGQAGLSKLLNAVRFSAFRDNLVTPPTQISGVESKSGTRAFVWLRSLYVQGVFACPRALPPGRARVIRPL